MKRKWQIGVFFLLVGLLLWCSMVGNTSWPTIFILIGVFFIFRGIVGQKTARAKKIPTLSKEREDHYLETGMSKREIDVFRETMSQTKEAIDQLQQNMTQNARLKAVDLRHNSVRAAKALFKELVKEPQKLAFASHFLYTHLPNLVDLTDKYLEISAHEIKSKETYDKMEESLLVIDQLAALIAKDYQNFVSDDFEELDVELSLAKQSIQRETK